MKKFKWICISLIFLYFSACNQRPMPQILLTADSLTDEYPDSTLVLLGRMKSDMASKPNATRMYYNLLIVKAKDKAYIAHTSDSIILEVVHYYENKKDSKLLAEAYYYAGRVFSDLGDAPQALSYFQKGIDASDDNTDYRLMSRIYSQMGELFLYQDVYSKAPEMFSRAYHYSLLSKDSVGMVYDLRDKGRAFSMLEQKDSALYYYRMADHMAVKENDERLKEMVNGELSGYYLKLNMYDEAYKSMQIAFRKIDSTNFAPRYITAANYFYHIHRLDSAEYYYSRLLHTGNCYYKAGGLHGLADIACQKGQDKKALNYFTKYVDCADSIHKKTYTETLLKVNALYNYQLKEKENNRLQVQAHKQQTWIFLLISLISFLILAFTAYRQYRKRKEQETRVQLEKLRRHQDEQYRQSLAYIEKNKAQIKELETALHEAETAKDEIRQSLIKSQKDYIEKSNEQISAKRRVQEQAVVSLKKSFIYLKFRDAAFEGITEIVSADWKELTSVVDDTYPDFSQRLLDLYPMNEVELKVCLLLKIEIPLMQIALITIRSKQSITSIRKRLYNKVMNEEGTPEQWDRFIREL